MKNVKHLVNNAVFATRDAEGLHEMQILRHEMQIFLTRRHKGAKTRRFFLGLKTQIEECIQPLNY